MSDELFFVIYIAGMPAGYWMFRSCLLKERREWTRADQAFGIFMAIFSWVNLGPFVMWHIEHSTWGNQKAKW